MQQGQRKRDVAEGNDVQVRINFGSTIFQRVADMGETVGDGSAIMLRNSICRLQQAGADPVRVRMQNECRKNVAKDHAGKDQSYAPHYQHAARASAGDGIGRTLRDLSRRNHLPEI